MRQLRFLGLYGLEVVLRLPLGLSFPRTHELLTLGVHPPATLAGVWIFLTVDKLFQKFVKKEFDVGVSYIG